MQLYNHSATRLFAQHWSVRSKLARELCDMIIDAVRQDKTVGRGTCSCVDECWTDYELLDFLCIEDDYEHGTPRKLRDVFPNPRQAVKQMREVHARFKELEQEALAS